MASQPDKRNKNNMGNINDTDFFIPDNLENKADPDLV
jgi:hypothetical protein